MEGPSQPRSTLRDSRPGDMAHGHSGVQFGRVLLMFKALVNPAAEGGERETLHLVLIRPFHRYLGQSILSNVDEKYVAVYEPSVRIHPDTADVVVSLSRILCEVDLVPHWEHKTFPSNEIAQDMPGAVFGESRMWIVDLMTLQGQRSNVELCCRGDFSSDPCAPVPDEE